MRKFIKTLENYLKSREFYVYCEIDYNISCKDGKVGVNESIIKIKDHGLLIYGVGTVPNPKELIELEIIPLVDSNITDTCIEGTIAQKTIKGDLIFKATKEDILNQEGVFTDQIDIHKEKEYAHDGESGEEVKINFNLMKFKVMVTFTDKLKKEIANIL